MNVPLLSRLRRRRLSAWGALLTRSLAAMGLLFAAALAAAAHNGPMSLVFLTIAALAGVAVVRAHQATRSISTAVRLHRTVEKTLKALVSRGWHVKHNVRWPEGPGDGHLAMNPSGELAFAIKDCTPAIDDFDLSQTQEFATALSETGRPYVPICVATANEGGSSGDRGVICSTPELLTAELLDAEQAFLTSLLDERVRQQLLYGEPAVN